jgi:plasmid stabilization system protein ParE
MQVAWGAQAEWQWYELLNDGLVEIADRIENMAESLAMFPDLGRVLDAEAGLRQFFVDRVRVVYVRKVESCTVWAILRPGERLG